MKPRQRRKSVVTDLDLEPQPNIVEMIAAVAARDEDDEKIVKPGSGKIAEVSDKPET